MTPVDPASTTTNGYSHADCLVLQDVSVAYDRKVVLSGVSADINRGQVVGVIGPNGGGKSTLLKAILGVIPTFKGSISLFGQPALKMRSHMACVPQREVVDWDFPVTVRDVVMMGRYPRTRWPHRAGQRDRDVVEQVLARVDMLDYGDTQIGQLSGGQQQRVFIARALAQESEVLLLDEPMTGIDNATQEVILDVIAQHSNAGGIVLLATHDLASASCACDCLCCVNERMISYGATEATYTPENLSETFGGPVIVLGPTGSRELAHAHQVSDGAHHAHQHENLGRAHS
jgi:manganese/zinc/iron transport system ATP- binding protein